MKIFTEKPLIDFIKSNPKYRVAIQDWASKIKKCEWECIEEILNDFENAEIINGTQCVFHFNIKVINFSISIVYIGQYVYVREIVRNFCANREQ